MAVNPLTDSPGNRRVTLLDVAAAAGVSVATCSYVLSGRTDRTRLLPEETQQKVTEAARRLGYTGNTAARMLRRQRTELIALVYAPPVGPWLDRLTMQCQDLAADHGYSVVGLPIRRPDRAEHALRVITQGYVDGAIFTHGMADNLDLDRLSHSTRALLAFSEHLPAGPADVVRNRTRLAIAGATRHLFESGRSRVAFLSHRPLDGAGPDDDLYQGYLDAHREKQRTADPALVQAGASSREEAVVAVRDLLRLPDPPEALLSESDRGALAGMQAARELGVRVPEDLAVVGVGNTSEGAFASPPLTSVGMAEFDFTAVIELLFARIDDPNQPCRALDMPWVLNIRSST
jgi:DNA-binding LacI/PurR family transcriptional regulator